MAEEKFSTHVPLTVGEETTVPSTGVLIVDTGLKDVHFHGVTLAENSVAAVAAVTGEVLPADSTSPTARLQIKTWASDGTTAGNAAKKVSWHAHGRR